MDLKTIRDAREAGLDRAVRAINAATGVMLEAAVTVGRNLRLVRDQQLWLARHGSYHEFLDQEVKIDRRRASLWVGLSIKWDALQNKLGIPQVRIMGQLAEYEMPTSAEQLEALDWLPEEQRGTAWRIVLTRARDLKADITASLVRSVIRDSFLLEEGEPAKQRNVSPERVRSIAEARIRIGEKCGDAILQNIDHGQLRVSEKELLVWARRPDEEIVFIGRALRRLGWNVSRGIERYREEITADSRVRDIVADAIARDKPITIRIHGWAVVVRPD